MAGDVEHLLAFVGLALSSPLWISLGFPHLHIKLSSLFVFDLSIPSVSPPIR